MNDNSNNDGLYNSGAHTQPTGDLGWWSPDTPTGNIGASPEPKVRRTPQGAPTGYGQASQTAKAPQATQLPGYSQEQMDRIGKKYRLLGRTPIWLKIILWILFFPMLVLAGGSGLCISYICINTSANLHQIEMSAYIALFLSILIVFVMVVLLFITANNWRRKVNKYRRQLKQRRNELLENVDFM